jgi:predicted dinucleotide-binding enzyme
LPESAASAEVIVLATPWSAVHEVLGALGDLNGKILFDCTNPLKPDLSGLELGQNTSAAEQIAAWAANARVVKIFNTTGSNNMENASYPPDPIAMLYCGNDAEAKQIAGQLAAELGFEAIDAGRLEVARLLEPFARLWIHLALHQGFGREFAFKIVRR